MFLPSVVVPRKNVEQRTITIKGHKVLVTSVSGNRSHVVQARSKIQEWARSRFDYLDILQDLI